MPASACRFFFYSFQMSFMLFFFFVFAWLAGLLYYGWLVTVVCFMRYAVYAGCKGGG